MLWRGLLYCSGRFIQIFIQNSFQDNKTAIIIEPTVIFESNNLCQVDQVYEKMNMNEKCIDFNKERLKRYHWGRNYEVYKWFGSSGIISTKTKMFPEEIEQNHTFLILPEENMILESIGIIHNHFVLYNRLSL